MEKIFALAEKLMAVLKESDATLEEKEAALGVVGSVAIWMLEKPEAA
jgi:hypothetical protein